MRIVDGVESKPTKSGVRRIREDGPGQPDALEEKV